MDGRTDIFSLGVVMYEMIAGCAPFKGDTASDVLVSILTQEPSPLRESSPAVSAELERIVAKALRKDRDERHQTVKDLLIDLKSLRQELGSGARMVSGVTSRVARAASTKSSAEYVVSVIKSHQRAALLALVVLILAAVSLIYLSLRDRAIESVAILPFANVGANPEMEYVADGITESIISNLSQLPQLKVMSRAAVFRYKGREVDPQAVGRELGVQAVLVARVVPRGDSLNISLELVDVRDNRQIWGEQYTQKVSELLRVQAEISREVSEKLQLRLTGAEQQQLAKRLTGNAEAYDLYLKGRFHWNRLTEADLKTAIQYFDQAIGKDPNYALAYVGLADSYIALGAEYQSPKEAMPKAKEYAEKAVKLDEALADAHASLDIIKLVYDWDFSGAERELRRNLPLNPQLVGTFSCALHYADPMGRNDEAIAEIKSALAVDPFSLPTNLELGCASYYGGQYDQSIQQLRDTLSMYPDHFGAIYGIGRAYVQKKKYSEAIAELSQGKTISGDWPPLVAELGYAYAASGESQSSAGA